MSIFIFAYVKYLGRSDYIFMLILVNEEKIQLKYSSNADSKHYLPDPEAAPFL